MSNSYKNFFNPNRAALSIPHFKDIEYLVKSIAVPNVRVGQAEIPTVFHQYPEPGDTMEFQPFNVSFNVDERLENYKAIFDWMVGLRFPNSFDEYREQGSKVIDIAIILYQSDYDVLGRIDLFDAFPVNLSELEINFEEQSTEPRVATVDFAISTYKFNIN